MSLKSLNLVALSLLLITSCSNLQQSQKSSQVSLVKGSDTKVVRIGPDIPFIPEKAFYPIHSDLDGVYYSWRECNFLGFNCKHREVKFKFSDVEMMKWFKSAGFGFCDRPTP